MDDDRLAHPAECTPLLGSNSRSEHEDLNTQITVSLLYAEAGRIVTLAWPIMVGYILLTSLSVASVLSLGHVGTKELASSALTTMFCNVTGFSIGIGINTAMDTLCSQAYTGSSDKYALGKHLQRSLIVMVLISIPISFLWLFTENILLMFGQDPEICRLSGEFALWMLPGLLPYLCADSMKRYLQCQGIVKAAMCVIAIVAPVNIFLQWFLVWSSYAIGIIGAPIATSVSNILIFLLTILYICFVEGNEKWGGWEWKEALNVRQIWIYMKLGVPGVAMVCSEWWAFELVALASGMLGDQSLAAQSIILNTISLTYILPMSFSIAASTRIGNSLGANRPFSSKVAAMTAYIIGAFLAVANCTFLFSVRFSWGYLFTSDVEVIRLVAEVLPLAALFQISDCLCSIGGGVLRGCGRQHLGAYMNLTGYYLMGLPIGVYLGFKAGFGLQGLWIGLSFALIIISAAMAWLVMRTDWNKEADNAIKLCAHTCGGTDAESLLGSDLVIEDNTEPCHRTCL
ncbi:ethionine resistance protein [Batrachochytrium dendrobatidis]|nr:ethionine resistance protein [Batrachochytrium dendrobatidis]